MKTARSRGLKKKGRDYERAAVRHISELYPGLFVPHPWIHVVDQEGPRWVQPDGLLIRPMEGMVTIVEFKLKHTPTAWFQLTELYRPVVEWLFPRDLWTIRLCEVCRWYDPSIFFPGEANLRPKLEEVKANEVGVYIWCP